MTTIKTNLLENHDGKFIEVVTYSTNNQNEKGEVIAKFLYKKDALFFFENMQDQNIFVEIVIR